ncbi:GntR family transcriptional regulator [Roseococcus pinisoli]|uniref:GntR family transcriptional regulator n=1 Tax=Roseococcus pinisoli TaxID=2835040 RepID=A0ABS5QEJ2_9PROT|nr:GntR family transcriptional regulator [Roseococcus pinisoli]MBS7811967.1 GntR family transcriptional regulator [Roseococcus pinisoli]
MDGGRHMAASGGSVAASKFGRLPAGRTPLYQALADQVQKVVGKLRLVPGTQLPTEEQLANHFGVSMITVRGALRELQQRGLIERRQGRGTFVAAPRAPTPEWGLGSIDEIQIANRLAEVRLLDSGRRPVPDWAAEVLGLTSGEPGQHLRIARVREGTPLMITDVFYPPAIGEVVAKQSPESWLPRYPLLVEAAERASGERMTELDQTMTATRATAEVSRILGVRAGDPLLVITRINRGASGRVLQVARTTYRTDVATYTMHMKRS